MKALKQYLKNLVYRFSASIMEQNHDLKKIVQNQKNLQ